MIDLLGIDPLGTRKRTADRADVPQAAVQELLRHHPHLDAQDVALVLAGLRQWYRAVQSARGAPLAMPSRVVDDLWHAHITCTRDYAAFTRRAFGRFLHHQPESSMPAAAAARNRGEHLRRTLETCRTLEGAALPLLFRVDEELDVEGARRYVLSCGVKACGFAGVTCLAHLPRAKDRSGSNSGGGCGGGSGCSTGSSSCGGGGGCGGGCGS